MGPWPISPASGLLAGVSPLGTKGCTFRQGGATPQLWGWESGDGPDSEPQLGPGCQHQDLLVFLGWGWGVGLAEPAHGQRRKHCEGLGGERKWERTAGGERGPYAPQGSCPVRGQDWSMDPARSPVQLPRAHPAQPPPPGPLIQDTALRTHDRVPSHQDAWRDSRQSSPLQPPPPSVHAALVQPSVPKVPMLFLRGPNTTNSVSTRDTKPHPHSCVSTWTRAHTQRPGVSTWTQAHAEHPGVYTWTRAHVQRPGMSTWT